LVTVEYHDDLNEVQGDDALATMLGSGPASAPFDRIAWMRLLAAHCDILPLVAVARDGDAHALLALRRIGRRIEALANWYSFRVRPLVSPGNAAPRLLAELARDLVGEAPRIVLSPLPDEHGEATTLATAFRAAGWLVFREQCDVNHVLHLKGRGYEEYLAGRPGPLRTTLKRKSGKVEVRVLTGFDAGLWDEYEAIYRESWKPEEGSPAFLRAFAEEEGAAGRLRFAVAFAEGRAIAAQMWTVEGGTAFIHKLAHREDAKPLSPGTVLSAALFRHVIDEDRVELVDFGTGNDPYKRDWMEEVRPRYRLDMLRPAWPGNWPAIAKRLLRGLAGKANHG